MELKPFTQADWYCYSGCEGEALISRAEDPESVEVIVHDKGLIVVYVPDCASGVEPVEPYIGFAMLSCSKSIAQEIVENWKRVPSYAALKALGFTFGSY